MPVPKGYVQSPLHRQRRKEAQMRYIATVQFQEHLKRSQEARGDIKTLIALSERYNLPYSFLVDLKERYRVHKARAKYRQIPFLLSWEQWLDIWVSSGQVYNRGKSDGQYVMARKGDAGPYSVKNVVIILAAKNNSDGHKH